MKYNCKRILSVLLTACMLFSMISPPAVYAAETDECTCGTEGETHASDCALYVAPTCTCTPAEGVHQEGCVLYEAPTCSCTPVEGVHQESCALYEAPTCSCTPVEGVHQEGCALYEAPTCSCTPVEGVHQEGCALYEAPTCTCTPVEGVHQEGCAQYEAPTCSCTPVDGVHQEGCALYEAPTCSCTPVDGVHQEGCALYEAPTCSCAPVDGVHQEGCALYVSLENDILAIEDDETITFNAGIYLDADRTLPVTELTSEGATLTWPFSESTQSAEDRYLGVYLDGLDMNKQYQLVVKMTPILYLNQTSDPTLDNAAVSFTRNSSITVNGSGSYQPHKYSLSDLTYLLNEGAEGMSIGLPLRFDVTLWNKKDGGSLGDGTTPLLNIELQEEQEDGTLVTVRSQKLMDATVSGSFPFIAGTSYHLVGGESTSSSTIDADDSVRIGFQHYGATTKLSHYAKTVKVEIKIPSCTVGEKKYYLSYRNFQFQTTSGALQVTLTDDMYDSTTDTLTVTAENLCFKDDNTFNMIYSAPADFQEVAGIYTFNGKITVTIDGETLNRSIAITLDTRNAADVKAVATTNGKANIKETDVVQPFGGLALKNDGTGHSAPLRIDLKFDTTTLSVTTVNLMCDRATETITIWYTLVDRDGNPAFPDENGVNEVFTTEINNPRYNYANNITTLNENDYKTFARANLPGEHREYFFETLSYTMGMLPANSKAYHTGASLAPYSAGTIWGYVNVTEIPDSMPTHTMTVYQMPADEEGEPKKLGSTSVITKIDTGTSVSYGLENGSISKSSITAGDSITISGKISTIRFPYSSNSCLNNIRLGVVLPAGAALNESSISATYENGNKLAVQSVTTQAIEGKTDVLYIVEFQEGRKIGYYSESLWGLENGTYLNFSVQVNTDKTMSSQTIRLAERVFVAGAQLVNAASGSFEHNAAQDIYDLNSNGSTTDNIGCFKITSTTAAVTIQAGPAQLAITDELTDKNGNTGASLTMETFADVLNYNLHIECTEGGSASEFYYMIPIAKTSMTSDPVFMEKCEVNLELKSAATVTASQGTAMKVLYSTTPITGYSGSRAINDWSETLPDGKSWSDVTVIKVVSSESTIENGSINVISVPLGLSEEVDTEYEHMAGYQIRWSSRGYYHYSLGYNSNSGTQSTKGCTITLTYTPQEPKCFTLTAAKGGTPTGEGAKSTYTFDLPEFILAQKYSVKEVGPFNVTLVDAEYDFSKATSTEANENFRITISVKKKSSDAAGSSPVAIQKGNEHIGDLEGNSAPEFTFAIENADALSDIVTKRTVNLVLIGDNGVIVPVEITINRELAPAEATTSAIVAGELYLPFGDTSTTTTVSCDSAFTAQFVTKYIRVNYTDYKLVFEHAPVSGTKITMIDWTDESDVKYYHYTMKGETSVLLKAFSGMGSSAAFTDSSNQEQVTEKLLFIVSFPASGESIRENTVKLTKTFKKDQTIETSDELTFTTVQKRTFSLTTSVTSVKCGDDFSVSYTSSCGVTDSRYTGRNLSLVVKPSEGTSFSEDSRLVVNGVSYSLNAQGNFLVPLKAVNVGNDTVTVSYHSQASEQVALQIELWASATANGSKPMMGEKVSGPVAVSVKAQTKPSFKVESMSKRLIEREDLSETITVSFQHKNAATVTVELQEKEGAGYVTQTTILESVNGNTQATQGVFTVIDNAATIKLSGSTEAGTYRLLFTAASADGVTTTVPYNFVVVN